MKNILVHVVVTVDLWHGVEKRSPSYVQDCKTHTLMKTGGKNVNNPFFIRI